jgi:reductive dehalogenase
MTWINALLLTFLILLFGALGKASFLEKRGRALSISILLLILSILYFSSLILFQEYHLIRYLSYVTWGFAIVISVGSIIPWRFPEHKLSYSDISPFDERNHMFSRAANWDVEKNRSDYYSKNPHLLEIDTKIFSKPNLGQPGSKYYDSAESPAADAAFSLINEINMVPFSSQAETKYEDSPQVLTNLVLNASTLTGGDAGVATIKPWHLYSHLGRQSDKWGETPKLTHKFAIVMAFPMDDKRISKAPCLPALLESSQTYLRSGVAAKYLAQYILNLGYDAKIHTDANYDLMCVPLAQDAGIGVTARSGILLHPDYGPNIRLAVVSTDMPLIPTPKTYPHISNFCKLCKKCARNCPSRAIEMDSMKKSRGFLHWSCNMEKCYSYWRTIGTDCAICIKVCPFSKPNTLIHRLVRWYISRNPANQYLALLMDDLLYGKRVKSKPKSHYLKTSSKKH